MAQIHVFGRVMHDLVPKEGQTKQPYVCFDLMERNGGNQPDFYQVWARGDDVARLMKLKVRKGQHDLAHRIAETGGCPPEGRKHGQKAESMAD